MAQKSFKRSGISGPAEVYSLSRDLGGAFAGLCAPPAVVTSRVVISDSPLLALLIILVGVCVMVFAVSVTLRVVSRRWKGDAAAATGLQAWAAQHGWELTGDGRLAAHWATRFHFSADALTTPFIAARGTVHGRDAMVFFCLLGTGEDPKPSTIAVVDVDADYPVTAVVRPKSANTLSHAYGSAVPIESVEFGRRWRAMGRDAAGSHAIFTPRLIERLLEPMRGGPPEIVWDGPGIRSADDSFIGDQTHLESRLLLLAELASLTPGYQVTRTNDDPSLLPYAPPPTPKIPVVMFVLIGLGFLLWQLAAAIFETESWVWVVASVAIGVGLMVLGVRLGQRGQERQVSKWRAAQAAALAPPGGASPPPQN